MRFHVQHGKTKIFGCQNPFTQGGGRKGLPRSFLNRFTQVRLNDFLYIFSKYTFGRGYASAFCIFLIQVYVDALTNEDMQFIGDSIFPNIDNVIISKMVQFSNRVRRQCLTSLVFFCCSFNWHLKILTPCILVFLFPKIVQEVTVERKWGQRGGPWEFNLRDLFRWCQLMQTDQSPGFFNPGQHAGLVYADRMRTEADKAQVATLI